MAIRRVKLDKGGYNPLYGYFGVSGAKLYVDDSRLRFLRAPDYSTACKVLGSYKKEEKNQAIPRLKIAVKHSILNLWSIEIPELEGLEGSTIKEVVSIGFIKAFMTDRQLKRYGKAMNDEKPFSFQIEGYDTIGDLYQLLEDMGDF